MLRIPPGGWRLAALARAGAAELPCNSRAGPRGAGGGLDGGAAAPAEAPSLPTTDSGLPAVACAVTVTG